MLQKFALGKFHGAASISVNGIVNHTSMCYGHCIHPSYHPQSSPLRIQKKQHYFTLHLCLEAEIAETAKSFHCSGPVQTKELE